MSTASKSRAYGPRVCLRLRTAEEAATLREVAAYIAARRDNPRLPPIVVPAGVAPAPAAPLRALPPPVAPAIAKPAAAPAPPRVSVHRRPLTREDEARFAAEAYATPPAPHDRDNGERK